MTIEPYQGIQSILQQNVIQTGPNNSTITTGTKKIDSIYEKPLPFPIYSSPQRSTCLQICGWAFDKKDSLEQALSKYKIIQLLLLTFHFVG